MNPISFFVCKFATAIINPIMTLLALAAFVLFIFGVVEMISNTEKPDDAQKKGKQHMLWGIIGLTIIFGAEALVYIIARTAGLPGIPFTCP